MRCAGILARCHLHPADDIRPFARSAILSGTRNSGVFHGKKKPLYMQDAHRAAFSKVSAAEDSNLTVVYCLVSTD